MPLSLVLSLALCTPPAAASGGSDAPPSEQESGPDLAERVEVLEAQIDALVNDLERAAHGADLVPPVIGSEWGLGPAASKIYQTEGDFSIGGYGEFIFANPAGGTDTFDAQRVILYFGQRFSDEWLLNTELEFEHGSTAGEGSVSVEFAYLDYMPLENMGFRAGVVLLPMGFVNELHEPNTFLTANRSQTETRIMPSTWRENGVGVFGEGGGFEYRAYVVNGLRGEGFSGSGLRGGRQRASEARAEDLALTGRLDWVDVPGLTLGGSFYHGDSSQDLEGVGDLTTTILEAHAELQVDGWKLRGLAAKASVDDVDAFNASQNQSLSEDLDGWYVEGGYDLFAEVFPVTDQSLSPFARFETLDTGSGDEEITTFGLAYEPDPHVIIKLDYEDWEGAGADTLNLLFGYVF